MRQANTKTGARARRHKQPGKDHGELRKARAAERRRLAAERAGAILAAGGLLRLPEVLTLVPVSPSTWWEGCRTGRFPAPTKVGPRCTAWPAASIRTLLDRLAAGGEVQQ